jgi:hypothetical protein
MIYESLPWKTELKRHHRAFKTWEGKGHTQRGGFFIERGIFLSAFILRKLMKNRKVTDAIRDRSIRCEAYRPFRPLSDRVSRFFGAFDPDTDYDLTKPTKVMISSFDLMSEIMHSYIFVPVLNDQGIWTAFLVNSYNKRDDRLLKINKSDFEKLVEDVINDHVAKIEVFMHPTSGKVIAEVRGKKAR